MQEVLPPGVGRVPQWWMEITPHYVLDLEEEEYRRRAEEQMAYYYAEMAAAADAGRVDASGNPILLGPDGKPIPWTGNNGWAGRSAGGAGGSGGAGPDGPLGRNFVPGQVTPETLRLLGISADSDPDYRSYLSGAKYPPGYWEKLAELGYTGPGFSANNLAQTDFGRYGRQAEQPKHKPSWAKMKLRSTTHGQGIRQGVYDSPKRETTRRVSEASDVPPKALMMPAPSLDDEPAPAPRAPPARPTPPPMASTSSAPAQAPPRAAAAPGTSNAPASPGKKKVIRKVRKVRRKREGGEDAQPSQPQAAPSAPPSRTPPPPPITLHVPPMPQPVQQHDSKPQDPAPAPARRYNHKDYYYNAPASNAHAGTSQSQRAAASAHTPAPPAVQKPASAPAPAPPVAAAPLPPPPPVQAPRYGAYAAERPSTITIPSMPVAPPSPYVEDDEVYEEEEEEEEIIEEYVDEEEYEEEDDLEDLQAILAAKQAELARLQAQLSTGG
jgi:hypothetical protein